MTFNAASGVFTPFNITTSTIPIIAPYFADVDTRAGNIVTYGQDMVNGNQAFAVNWINVGYYNQHTDKTNVFQLVIISRADRAAGDFDVEFNYSRVQWETGDKSGGSGGLGGYSARAGLSNGTGTAGTNIELSGSGVNGAFLDSNPTTGLIYNSRNSSVLGQYLFTIQNSGGPLAPTTGSTTLTASAPTVRGMKPDTGPAGGGTLVTIVGTDFTGAKSVTFGGVAAKSFTVKSNYWLTATAPAHAAGTVDVRVMTAAGTSAITALDRFTYTSTTTSTSTSMDSPTLTAESEAATSADGVWAAYGLLSSDGSGGPPPGNGWLVNGVVGSDGASSPLGALESTDLSSAIAVLLGGQPLNFLVPAREGAAGSVDGSQSRPSGPAAWPYESPTWPAAILGPERVRALLTLPNPALRALDTYFADYFEADLAGQEV